ncbi:ABC transporter ATP-binding protein [Pseudoclavibacter chungangensis]|uniref:ABC transporter ATP-binding protein n=1 Tax=Pseudoclavibacter chungangensis TaxID=587635 RepID=UPI001CE483EE
MDAAEIDAAEIDAAEGPNVPRPTDVPGESGAPASAQTPTRSTGGEGSVAPATADAPAEAPATAGAPEASDTRKGSVASARANAGSSDGAADASGGDTTAPAALAKPSGTTGDLAPLLVVDDATVVFPGPRGSRRRALDGVSIRIAPGETLGVVGESGSGKSTLGRAVLGLQRLDAGSVELFGAPWSALPERRRRPLRRRVQVISQDPLGSFDPRLTVGQLIDQPLRLGPRRAAAERRAEAVRLLGLVDLDGDLLGERPGRLSGGQRQRVSIAQALASDPELLVADEPVSALDVLTQAQVLDLLVELQARVGLAMLFISHDLGVVQHLTHRIAVMKDGRIVETGPVDEVFDRPRHPYTVELFDAVPRIGTRPSPAT